MEKEPWCWRDSQQAGEMLLSEGVDDDQEPASTYPDDNSVEAAEHNAEVARLRAWQEGRALPAMTGWEREAMWRREGNMPGSEPVTDEGR